MLRNLVSQIMLMAICTRICNIIIAFIVVDALAGMRCVKNKILIVVEGERFPSV